MAAYTQNELEQGRSAVANLLAVLCTEQFEARRLNQIMHKESTFKSALQRRKAVTTYLVKVELRRKSQNVKISKAQPEFMWFSVVKLL